MVGAKVGEGGSRAVGEAGAEMVIMRGEGWRSEEAISEGGGGGMAGR